MQVRDANENPVYKAAPSYDALKKALEEKLADYNENNASMDLVGYSFQFSDSIVYYIY